MENSERIGWLAGLTGVAGLGGVAALGAARNVARNRVVGRSDPYADVDFTTIYDLSLIHI